MQKRINLAVWRRTGIPVGMSELERFEMLEDYAVFRPIGQVTLEHAAEMVTEAIAFARAHRIRKLLVNASNLTGYESPGLASRYFFVHEWARAAAGGVRVALVTKPEKIDPKKFGITVAANVGFISEVFTTEEEALQWLQLEE